MILAWLLKNWRLVALAAAALAVVALFSWFSHVRYAAGEAAGRAHVQADWDAARKAQRAAYAAAEAAAFAKQQADKQSAQEVESALREKLAGADAGARDLARRLHDYAARAARCTVPTAPGSAPDPGGLGGSTGGDDEIARAAEDVYAACGRDAERLNGWSDWATKVGLLGPLVPSGRTR